LLLACRKIVSAMNKTIVNCTNRLRPVPPFLASFVHGFSLSLLSLPAIAGAAIPLERGLVITTVTHAGLAGTAGSLDVADTETLYSVSEVAADRIVFGFKIAAPGDQKASDLLKEPLSLKRAVRKEDLTSANRINLSWGSDDPDMFPGQTFIQTSTAVLKALKTKGEAPFVMALNEGGMFSGIEVPPSPSKSTGDAPLNLGGLMAALGVERHYYRGTLKRVEAGTVPVSVLLNGERTSLPAVHARGALKYSDTERTVEFYWLDDAANALTLKWVVGKNYSLVTRIDVTPPQKGEGHGGGMGQIDIGTSATAERLAGKTCRAELHGIYFATGSAKLLEESMPTLESLSALLQANPSWTVTIEGHTDNIGSADYNLNLSNRRAAAVRDALTGRYHIPAARISAKGFGLTKPRESNATDEGRARNRRVEVARACAS
jgi:outer membrane protein OmpA-like peptidoglycan-associated protein